MYKILGLALVLISTSAFSAEANFFEIVVNNQKKAQSFYAKTLGWKFQEVGDTNFVLVTNAGIKGALLSTTEKVKRGNSVKLFFKVSHLLAALREIKNAGGTVEIDSVNVGDNSWIAEFKDPDGNWLGLICTEGDACLN